MDSLRDSLNDEDQPFFDGLAAGELRLPWCDSCVESIWPPRTRCPRCYSPVGTHRALNGRGIVYSFSIVHRGEGPFADRELYVYAYVQLEDGPVVPANIVGNGSTEVVIGARVTLSTEASRDSGFDGATFIVEGFSGA